MHTGSDDYLLDGVRLSEAEELAAQQLAIFLFLAVGGGWTASQNATEARESLALALATTASTWQNPDEAFVLALASVRLEGYTVRTHDLATDVIQQPALQRVYRDHIDWVDSVAYSPDEQTVLSGSADATLRLWDVSTGEVLRTFEGQADSVWGVAYRPNGEAVLSSSGDGAPRLWTNRSSIEIACTERYIVPEAAAAMRQQFGIPDDVVL